MRNRVTFLIVVETNLDDYPEDQGTEVYKGEFICKTDSYMIGQELRKSVLDGICMYVSNIKESWGVEDD